MQETQEMLVWSLGWEDPLEEEMAIHSSILAWKIPWTDEPGGLQSMGPQRVGYNWGTLEGNGSPLQYSCLENPRDGGAWWAAVYGVTQSRTRLKWLSSSSSFYNNNKKKYFCVQWTKASIDIINKFDLSSNPHSQINLQMLWPLRKKKI